MFSHGILEPLWTFDTVYTCDIYLHICPIVGRPAQVTHLKFLVHLSEQILDATESFDQKLSFVFTIFFINSLI